MEQIPNGDELRDYSYARLEAAVEQHLVNIQTYRDIINQETGRINWIKAVIKSKKELEDAAFNSNDV